MNGSNDEVERHIVEGRPDERSTEESIVQELAWTQEPGTISGMLCILEMMRWRDIVEGRLDESSQDPREITSPGACMDTRTWAISAVLCVLGMISDA